MAVGTGLVTLGVSDTINTVVESAVIEAMTAPLAHDARGGLSPAALNPLLDLCQGKSALALGPGLDTHEGTRTLVKNILKQCTLPVILDADGLNLISDDPGVLRHRSAPTILTPPSRGDVPAHRNFRPGHPGPSAGDGPCICPGIRGHRGAQGRRHPHRHP